MQPNSNHLSLWFIHSKKTSLSIDSPLIVSSHWWCMQQLAHGSMLTGSWNSPPMCAQLLVLFTMLHFASKSLISMCWYMSDFTLLKVTAIFQTYKTTFLNRGIFTCYKQIHLETFNMLKKSKHASIDISCLDTPWSLHMLFTQVRTSESLNMT